MLQAAARELAPTSRVRGCLRAIIPGKNEVEVWHNPDGKRAFYRNLITCNRVWVCPVCASKITERRRVELDRVLNATYRLQVLDVVGQSKVIIARRFYLAMATLTIAHHQGESLRVVLGKILNAYHRTWSGRWATAYKKQYRVIGMIRALEVTHGRNGWHPHIHILLIRDSANTESSIANLDLDLTLRWSDQVRAIGGVASDKHGVCVQAGDHKNLDYISKMGQQVAAAIERWGLTSEITKYPTKRGRDGNRTTWDLLADYASGDVGAGELWIESVAALKGKAHLNYSRGLWKTLQIPEQAGDDDIMAQEQSEPGDLILARLNLEQWNLVIRHDQRGQLLEIAARGDESAVMEFIGRLT
jgi:hypothetical protein